LKVSALIPIYNRRTHEVQAIQSVLAQTMPVDEIVVVDDGSTDGTISRMVAVLRESRPDRGFIRMPDYCSGLVLKEGVGSEEYRAVLDSGTQENFDVFSRGDCRLVHPLVGARKTAFNKESISEPIADLGIGTGL
jgi:glycosyltransferase involved in cell wall biosynthesis